MSWDDRLVQTGKGRGGLAPSTVLGQQLMRLLLRKCSIAGPTGLAIRVPGNDCPMVLKMPSTGDHLVEAKIRDIQSRGEFLHSNAFNKCNAL